MTQYLLLIHDNATGPIPPSEWEAFFVAARESGLFKGGSALGARTLIGNPETTGGTDHLVGYMRFDAQERGEIEALLRQHPVVRHGGSVELCEMPRS